MLDRDGFEDVGDVFGGGEIAGDDRVPVGRPAPAVVRDPEGVTGVVDPRSLRRRARSFGMVGANASRLHPATLNESSRLIDVT